MDVAVTTLISGGFALFGAFVGVWTAARFQKDQWIRDAQLRAYTRMMDEYSILNESLALLVRGDITDLDWRPWSQARNLVSLVCGPEVVMAANLVDHEFYLVHSKIRTADPGDLDWFQLIRPLESTWDDFVNVARSGVNPRNHSRIETHGRPGPESEIWAKSQQLKPGDDKQERS